MGTGTDAVAAVQRICLVATQVKTGWSPEREHRVAFVTGLELSRIAPNLKIDLRRNYALILPKIGLPTVVMVDPLIRTAGQEFSAGDFARTFEQFSEREGVQVVGNGHGLKWQIRARTPAGWVDPQMY